MIQKTIFYRLACSSSLFAFCFLLFASFALPLSAASVVTSPSGRTISVKLDAPQASALAAASAVATPAAATASALSVVDRAGDAFGVTNAAAQLRVVRTDTDIRGATHVRCAQVYKGLRVLGGSLAVHFRKTGAAYEVDGQFVTLGEIDTTPRISAANAVVAARVRHAGALVAAPELVIYARLSCAAAPRLAWTFSLREAANHVWLTTVDARTGMILDCYDNVKRAAAEMVDGMEQIPSGEPVTLTGSIQNMDGGGTTNLVGWKSTDGDYFLNNTNELWQIGYSPSATNGMPEGDLDNLDWCFVRSGSASWTSTVFDAGNTWNGASVSNNLSFYKFATETPSTVEFGIAVDLARVLAYYRAVHDWNGWDGEGAMLTARLYQPLADNAAWDGSAMTIGYGAADMGDPGALDVIGHEITHAVTNARVGPGEGLTYQGESGALNESFSDVLGACIEFHWQPDGRDAYPSGRVAHADWLIGEDSTIHGPKSPAAMLRDMRNPMTTLLAQAVRQPSRRFGTYWHSTSDDHSGVHYNSSVQNFFFYLLCEGGQGFNDNAIPYDVTGVGIEVGEQIAFAAQGHCAPDDTYSEMPARWLSGAADVADGDTAKFTAYSNVVAAAWAAVLTVPPAGTNDDLQADPPGDSFLTEDSNSITLSTTNNGAIYYTIDGSFPSPTNAVVFTNGTPISLSTVDQSIRAAVYDAASNRLTDVIVLSYVSKQYSVFQNAKGETIPYAWIGQYHPEAANTPAAYRALAEVDSDGDGFVDSDEYFCSTDPTNATSVLRAVIGFDEAGQLAVTSSPAPEDMTNSPMQVFVAGSMVLTTNEEAWVKVDDVATSTNRFFRIVILPDAE